MAKGDRNRIRRQQEEWQRKKIIYRTGGPYDPESVGRQQSHEFPHAGFAEDESPVMDLTDKDPPEVCPNCGHKPLAKIMYGYPPPLAWLQEELQKGTIVLGGCCIGLRDPQFQCVRCGIRVRWTRLEE